MKKSILALAVVLGASSTFAQDLTSKKGENYLPEAGDWAISVDATPILSYVGNFFGKTANNIPPTFDFLNVNSTAIQGKYFVEDGMAYRVGLNINFGTQTRRANTTDYSAGAAVGAEVEDTRKISTSGVYLTGGLEWRKGTTRLQGFYGAEAGIGFGGGSKTVYTYGNEFDFTNVNTSSQTNAVDGVTDTREIKQKGGIAFGIRGFIGAEYFILPKLALGGEFGWGLGLATTGEKTTTANRTNLASTGLEDFTTVNTSKGSDFVLGTDNMTTLFSPTASMKISFYF